MKGRDLELKSPWAKVVLENPIGPKIRSYYGLEKLGRKYFLLNTCPHGFQLVIGIALLAYKKNKGITEFN